LNEPVNDAFSAVTMPLHETLESFYGTLPPVSDEERASLLGLGLPESAVTGLFSTWMSEPVGIGSSRLMRVDEIGGFDWQANTLKHGLLTVGSCANGDPIALDVAAGAPWPVYYLSHGHGGLYGDGELTRVRVSESFERFLIEFDADENFPWDYFEAEDRFGGPAGANHQEG
jgi:hypothetical protein